MAKIEVTKNYSDDITAIREGIEKLGQDLQREHKLNYTWVNDDRVEFKHKSASGFIQIEAEQIVLKMKLSMLYAAMAPVVKARINELADQYIH
jgi:putative polyhydroxyalkanoate system protein